MELNDKIFVSGHESMIGSAIMRQLKEHGFTNLLTTPSSGMDLTNQQAVLDFFTNEKPGYVFLTSLKVGGIMANNQYPAEFIYLNLQSEANVIHGSWKFGVKKLLFLTSSCVYPKDSPQPMKEEYLLSGTLEPTSEPYAIAKIAGIRMCQAYNRQYGTNFISAVPADTYGPEDDFNPETGHVLPALIAKIHHSCEHNEPQVIVWGTGKPRRETLHVNDLADASIFLMNTYNKSDMINIGTGKEYSVRELAELISKALGYKGKLVFDESKPDGAPIKLLDNGKIKQLGWLPEVNIAEGIKDTYQWYKGYL